LDYLPTAFALHAALSELDPERVLRVLSSPHASRLPAALVTQACEFLERAALLVGDDEP
jgi:inactivated superfamily I helicase